jgi:phosphatidylinositol 4-phosphatase
MTLATVSVIILFLCGDNLRSPLVLSEAQTVFSIQGVTAVPLFEDRARIILNTLASKQATAPRPSLMPGLSVDSVLRARQGSVDESILGDEFTTVVEPVSTNDSTPHVKFAEEHEIKVVTPLHSTEFDHHEDVDKDDSPPTPSSTTSTVSDTSIKAGTIAKTLADRLSFWTRVSKRAPLPGESAANDEGQILEAVTKENISTDDPVSQDSKEESVPEPIAKSEEQVPSDALHSIVQAQAPAPISQAAQHAELEKKIVREIVREYTAKGGMYFSYTFGQYACCSIRLCSLSLVP